jgi:hypothetical protein
MNIRDIDSLIRVLAQYVPAEYDAIHDDVLTARQWCQAQRRRQTKRKLEFKLKAAEQQEALR